MENSLIETKKKISSFIKEDMKTKGMTLRELCDLIDMKHPQIVRITRGNNYNIETLVRILDGLGLEIEIKKKEKTK